MSCHVVLERLKAARARKMLQKRAAQKEEKKAAAIAAGLDWHTDDSDDEPPVIGNVYVMTSDFLVFNLLLIKFLYWELINWLIVCSKNLLKNLPCQAF